MSLGQSAGAGQSRAASRVSPGQIDVLFGTQRALCPPQPHSHTRAASCPVIYKTDPAKTKEKGGEWCDLSQEEQSEHSTGIPGL